MATRAAERNMTGVAKWLAGHEMLARNITEDAED
jgi:hypothetical protein